RTAAPPLSRHRPGTMGRTPATGIPDLRPGVARAGIARTARALLSVSRVLRAAPLRLRRPDAVGTVDSAGRLHGGERQALVDDCAGHPVLPPYRASAAADAGDPRTALLRQPSAHEPRAVMGAARRAAPLLQHRRVRPDG